LGAIYSEDRISVRVLFIFPVTLKAKYLLLAAGAISIAGVVVPIGRVAHLAHLGGLVGGLWCVNWLKIQTLLQIGEEEPLPTHVEPPSTG
jgi:membrane associated rhomboid family serine protease